MHNIPSRREHREAKFYKIAENGGFSATTSLFKGEASGLIKKGFTVVRNGSEKVSVLSSVSWKEPFSQVPPIVSEYILGNVKTFPKGLNWAQELYTIAARANYEMHEKNNE